MLNYDEHFFRKIEDASYQSAREVLPYVLDLLQPRSVVDVGCGVGTWLAFCLEQGVPVVLGVDGDYVPRGQLRIPPHLFMAHDLSTPLRLDARYDLALSLEVGEHLPATSASAYVKALVRLAPVVLFSAAIPGQGGNHHINEQWPDYWAALFREHEYHVIDSLRPRFWRNDRVAHWYRQNLLLFVAESHIRTHPHLEQALAMTNPAYLSVVHPVYFERAVDANLYMGTRTLLPLLLKAIVRAAKRRIRFGSS